MAAAAEQPILSQDLTPADVGPTLRDHDVRSLIDARGRRSFDTKHRVRCHSVPDEMRYELDRPRPVPRLKVDVEVRNCINLILPNGTSCVPGTQTIEIYADQLQDVLDMVEPLPHDYEAAKDAYERALARYVMDGQEFKTEAIKVRTQNKSPDKVLALVMSGKDPEIEKLVWRARMTTGFSPESIFYELHKRSPCPLISAVVVDELPVPESHIDQQRAAMSKASTDPIVKAILNAQEAQDRRFEAMLNTFAATLATALAQKAGKP